MRQRRKEGRSKEVDGADDKILPTVPSVIGSIFHFKRFPRKQVYDEGRLSLYTMNFPTRHSPFPLAMRLGTNEQGRGGRNELNWNERKV